MKSSKLKLGLALAATCIVGFVGGFVTKSGIDFLTPTITTAYSCVTPLSPVTSAVTATSGPLLSRLNLLPVSYGGLFDPFDFQVSPLDAMNSFNQISNVPSIRTENGAKEFKVVAELPGMEQKNVQVDIESDFLTIKGKQVDQEGGRILKSASFVRSMKLPRNVDSRHAQHDFKNGVLTISIPKIDVDNAQHKRNPSLTTANI